MMKTSESQSPSFLLLLLAAVVLLLLTTTLLPQHQGSQVVDAFPFGAGGCPGGRPAVDGSHLSGQPGLVSQDLSGAGFPLTIDGSPLAEASPQTPFQLQTNVEYTLTLTGNDAFRGILVRAELLGESNNGVADEDDALLEIMSNESGGLLSAAGACGCPDTDATECFSSTVVGITHTSNVDKTSASLTLKATTSGPVQLDVTLVVNNVPTQQLSTYYYQGFPLLFVEDDEELITEEEEEVAATATPTAAPVTTTPAPTTAVPVPVPVTTTPEPTTAVPAPVAPPEPTTGAPVVNTATVTEAPVTTEAPTVPPPTTAAPTTAAPVDVMPVTGPFPPCNACGTGGGTDPDEIELEMTLLDATIEGLASQPISCRQVLEDALMGVISPELCQDIVPQFTQETCGCVVVSVVPPPNNEEPDSEPSNEGEDGGSSSIVPSDVPSMSPSMVLGGSPTAPTTSVPTTSTTTTEPPTLPPPPSSSSSSGSCGNGSWSSILLVLISMLLM